MPFSLLDVVGTVGVLLIVAAYLLLQTGRLDSKTSTYSAVNGLGSALVLASLTVDFNLSAVLIEVFWLAISLYGLYRAFARRRGAG